MATVDAQGVEATNVPGIGKRGKFVDAHVSSYAGADDPPPVSLPIISALEANTGGPGFRIRATTGRF